MILLHSLRTHNFKRLREVCLVFPPRGSILIEGDNEAGKSSLFEAVYFAFYGKPLLKANDFGVDQLKTYHADALEVELGFSIEGRQFSILRRVGERARVTLKCPAADGGIETIGRAGEVINRLKSEIRLSADALLNSCFVEQKKLERLDSLNSKDRERTVNELLNLKVFTTLTDTFKVTREDIDQLKQLQARHRIAELDQQFPLLREATIVARRSLAYVRLLNARSGVEECVREIQSANQREAQIQTRRGGISTELMLCQDLHRRIRSLESELPSRLMAWSQALQRYTESADRVAGLETLEAGLPGRTQQLVELDGLLGRLRDRESLLIRAGDLETRIREADQRVREWDALHTEWSGGQTELGRLHTDCDVARQSLKQTEETWQRRQEERAESARLDGFVERINSWRRLAEQRDGVRTALETARQAQERLPGLENRVRVLADLENKLRKREQDERALQELTQERTRLEERQRERQRREEATADLTSRVNVLRTEVEDCDRRDRATADAMRLQEQRAALLEWAEATERTAEAQTAATTSGALAARRQELAHQAADFETEVRALAWRAIALGAAGMLLTAAAALARAIPAALAACGLGVVVAILFALRAWQRATRLKPRALLARTEIAQLEGEQRALGARPATTEEERTRLASRLQDAVLRLQSAVTELPATSEYARQAAGALPEASLNAARHEYELAHTELLESRANLTAQEESLAELQQFPLLPNLAEEQSSLETRQSQIRLSLETAATLDDDLQAAGLPGASTEGLVLERELVIEARSAAAQTAGETASLAGRLADLQQQVESDRDALVSLAAALKMDGTDLDGWETSARLAQTEQARAAAVRSDTDLQADIQHNRKALDNVQEKLTGLLTEQAGRRRRLDATWRESLSQQRDELHQQCQQCHTAIAETELLLHTLRTDALPETSPELALEIQSRRTRLDTDCSAVDALPAAKIEQARRRAASEEQAALFAAVWSEVLSDVPVPGSPEDAAGAIPVRRQRLEDRLGQHDESGLKREDQELEAESREVLAAVAVQTGERERLGQIVHELLSTFPDAASIHTLPERYPELERALGADEANWTRTIEKAQDAERQNRADRQALALPLQVGEELVSLEEAREAVTQAEQELAVRRRSGQIVNETRAGIVGRVMPLTTQKTQRILPLLTAGRYRDVEWDPDNDRLEVFDSAARAYVRKRVFSGGARDQISLALRLGFALATLPGEYAIRPGFLFLDEPLSSFDRGRTDALVQLVTRGLLREPFPQRLLISHSESFNPSLFDYRIRMHEGDVVESSLPVV